MICIRQAIHVCKSTPYNDLWYLYCWSCVFKCIATLLISSSILGNPDYHITGWPRWITVQTQILCVVVFHSWSSLDTVHHVILYMSNYRILFRLDYSTKWQDTKFLKRRTSYWYIFTLYRQPCYLQDQKGNGRVWVDWRMSHSFYQNL